MKHKLWAKSLYTTALLGFFLGQAALSTAQELIHPYESTESTVDSTLSTTSASVSTTGTGAAILLLVDKDTTGTTNLTNALSAAGFNVTRRPPPEYTWDTTNPPLTDFDCVIHLNGNTYQVPLPVTAQTALVDFVRNGGGFIGSQWNGYERATNRQVDMNDLVLQLWPGPRNCGSCSQAWLTVAGQESHPVLDGIPSEFSFSADGHSDGQQVQFDVDPSTVLMRSNYGGPAVLVREFAEGRVVNFAHADNYFGIGRALQDLNIQKLYTNAATWACISRIIEGVGFEAPLDQGPVLVNKHRVLPMKAELLEEGLPVTDLDIVAPPVIEVVFSSATPPNDPIDVTDDALTAGLGTDGNQFVFTDESKW
ncbi:MAG: hypothetical protein ABFS39_13295, partial [Pseudomonadota bacterium]